MGRVMIFLIAIVLMASCKSKETAITEAASGAKLNLDFKLEPAKLDSSSKDLSLNELSMLPVGAGYDVITPSGGRARLEKTDKGVKLMAENVKSGAAEVKQKAAAESTAAIKQVAAEDKRQFVLTIIIFCVFIGTGVLILLFMRFMRKG